MEYKEFISYADPRTLDVEFNEEEGMVHLRMQVSGVSMYAIGSVDNEGIYGFGLIGSEDITTVLNAIKDMERDQ